MAFEDGQIGCPFYTDLREPCISSNVAAVTLGTTDKALYPAAAFPFLGGQYFCRPGKRLRIRLFGRYSPGINTLTWAIRYGTGADANGTVLASSAGISTSTGTNLSWWLDIAVHCRSIGSAGTLFACGYFKSNESTVAPIAMIPASAPAVSGACNLTAANIISVQAKLGAGTMSIQVHDLEVIAMN